MDCDDGSDETECVSTTTNAPVTQPMKPVQVELVDGPIYVRQGDTFEIVCRVKGTLSDLVAVFYKNQVKFGFITEQMFAMSEIFC